MTDPASGDADALQPEFRVARVFDFADPVSGPGFEPGHAVIADPVERERIGAYLRGGFPVLTSSARLADIVDPTAGEAVPASFRTDGEWIWTDTVEYYLSRHGLAPDERLIEHIRGRVANGQSVPDTSRERAAQAADFMLRPRDGSGAPPA
ncbi:MAG TPA: hypothetical protein VHF26_02150 [Trebonia sp.]|jgi:hypothetical protein|nr:hypothetical protein [Trebonia sp.]